MDVTPLVKEGQQIIQSYTNGFRVSGQKYDESIIVFPEKTLSWNKKRDVSDLSIEDFIVLAEYAVDIDVVLLGTGSKIKFLSGDLRAKLKGDNLHIETMDTGAACRTYNVLVAEGRRVVAALLPY